MMRIIGMLLLTCGLLFGAKIDTYAEKMGFLRDYNQAITVAKKANKPVMLVVVADYCPWCRKLERRTLAHKEVKKRLNEVVGVIVDKAFDEGTFPAMFNTPRYPTVFFIRPQNGEHFFESIGYVSGEDFLEVLNEVAAEYKK